METLEDIRKSIGNVLVAMFAERFKVTNRVGCNKVQNDLATKDTARRKKQYKRMDELARQYGLYPEFAESYLSAVSARVILNREEKADGAHDG